MTIANAFKEFFYSLTGVKPAGTTIADVIRNGTANIADESEKTAIVLKSSTADSVKKFNITVDDSGTVTATEIVAGGE